MKRRSCVGIVLVLLAAVTLPLTALADHSWGNYHWAREANPFTLKLGDNVSSSWDGYLAASASDWSASPVLDTVVVAGSTSSKKCGATLGRVEVCADRYGNTGWLGIAQIWATGDHITQGVVKLNDFYFNSGIYNTPSWRNLVMCQEVGHTLGLDHQDEDFDNTPLGTCMDYSDDPEPNQRPNAHDYQQLEAIYSHLDATTTVLDEPPAKPGRGKNRNRGSFGGAGQSEWGREQGRDAAGRPNRFLMDLGGGERVLTFVFWTKEHGVGH